MNWLTDPVYAVDSETTGTDPDTARVVTLTISVSQGAGDWHPSNWLINPGVPIPPGATAVHGITDEQAATGRDPADALTEAYDRILMAARVGLPLVLHNAAYDLTLLDREFRRHLDKPLPPRLVVIDTLVLFRRFDLSTGSRTLEQLAHRNGIQFPAHNAEQDALATLRLLHILCYKNDVLPHVDPGDLHRLQAGWYAAQQKAAHFRRVGSGDVTSSLVTDWPLRPFAVQAEDAA